ncbi:FecR domain-containing protein [Variovorax sp. IB41]|uniref:FecR domain-containing protein n=1 Tax=Variovorax sp. IB41 TaxID=2779370 RepID=UPI0018E7590B|nr:FecR domain-containing protein [Variovorax sp. IB41]
MNRALGRRVLCMLALGLCAPFGYVAAQSSHVVRPGDTLWGISGQHYRKPGRWPEIQQRNSVDEPRLLQPGTVLYFADGRALGEDEAMVLAVTGQAWQRRPGAPEVRVAAGAAVKVGDTLATDAGSFVTLGLPDGSRSVIPSHSAIALEAVDRRRIGFRLLDGSIESQVRKQHPDQEFKIRSRSLVLSVRGTRFRVRAQDGQVVSEVLEGRVAASQGSTQAEVSIEAGQGIVLGDAADRPTVRALLPAPQFASQPPSADSPGVEVTQVAGAQGYRWRIAQDEMFLAPLVEGDSAGTSLALPTALDAGFYHLQVAAVDEARLEGMPGNLLFYMPQPGGTSQWKEDGRIELRWAGSSARNYRLELSRDPDFAVLVTDQKGMQASSAIVGPFVVGGRYHWRVSETQDGEHYGPPFTGGSIDVPAR